MSIRPGSSVIPGSATRRAPAGCRCGAARHGRDAPVGDRHDGMVEHTARPDVDQVIRRHDHRVGERDAGPAAAAQPCERHPESQRISRHRSLHGA
jgi:hypothetical protein